jgi:hypothetical protein
MAFSVSLLKTLSEFSTFTKESDFIYSKSNFAALLRLSILTIVSISSMFERYKSNIFFMDLKTKKA